MLLELSVENYAVIESVRVPFHPGLNLMTGETGSGKSIVVDALALLLGGRASADMIRAGADRARVSGIFEVSPNEELTALLEPAGVEIEDGELLVEREIQAGSSPSGSVKSRAFVGNRPATAALLKSLAPFLADIHGQHDQQHLFSPQVQCAMLDAFLQGSSPKTTELLSSVRQTFREWRQAKADLEELDVSAREKLRLADLWSFQRNEIEAVAPRPGEDAELENERTVLRNVVKLQQLAGTAQEALFESQDCVAVQVGAILKKLDELARIDEKAREILNTLAPARVAIDDASRLLGRYLDHLEADPARLDEVEGRLAALEKLKRKYGSSSGSGIDEVLAYLEEARRELEAVETSSTRRSELEQSVAKLAKRYEKQAGQLSEARKDAARSLSKKVQQELAGLAMEKARVEIRVEAAEWSDRGADRIEFLISTNPGEELKPLEKIASGGELSRISLALKTCTTGAIKKDSVPRTLVFDEVDAGVGGGAAEAVGRRLKQLSGAGQVLCVTHLPQIAGFADHHYFVAKHTARGRTTASIEELTGGARAREIGRMLSGETITPEAMKHAQQLLKLGTGS